MSASGEPRVCEHEIQIPLFLACRPKPASKTAMYKFTLDTDAPALPLTDIFDDFLFAYQDAGMDVAESLGPSATQAIGFQFWTSSFEEPSGESKSADNQNDSAISREMTGTRSYPALVSILVSKNAGRYRVQSDCLAALYVIMKELDVRLTRQLNLMGKGKSDTEKDTEYDGPTLVKCSDQLPLVEYFAVIDSHFQTRHKLQDCLSLLNDNAHQLRMIQRRLLVRYKDRNPTPLLGLDTLFKESYKKIIQLGDNAQTLQNRISRLAVDLLGVTRLVVLLAGLKFELKDSERKLLESYFCVGLSDNTEQVRLLGSDA
jgi:Bardet-Biedl syndrome 9 protein